MTGHAAVFDSELRARTWNQYGRFDISKVQPWSLERQMLEYQARQARFIIPQFLGATDVIRPLDGIHFDFADDSHLNAGAFVVNNFAYISLPWGSVYLLHDLFYRMLSHPDVLPNIGHRHEETLRPFHREPLTDDFRVTQQRRLPNYPDLVHAAPNCNIRRACAEHLAMAALFFLIEHELGHIKGGHSEYWDSLGVAVVNELPRPIVKPPNEKLIHQALEYEADTHAVAHSLGSQLRLDTSKLPFGGPSTPEAKFSLWKFAVFSVFGIFGFDFDAQAFDLNYYPHPAVRVFAIEHTIKEILQEKHPYLLDHHKGSSHNHMRMVAHAFAAITGSNSKDEYLRLRDGLTSNVVEAHAQKIWRQARDQSPELARFAHFKQMAWPSADEDGQGGIAHAS